MRKNFCYRVTLCLIAIYFLCSTESCFAESPSNEQGGPWFTGTLISAPGVTTAPGVYDIEPYMILTETDSSPSIFSINPALLFFSGLANRLDIQVWIPYTFNKVRGMWEDNFQDANAKLGIQAIRSPENHWLPNVRLILAETFPTGQHEGLRPELLNADSTGSGSYQTGIGANLQQLYKLFDGHYLRLRLNLLFSMPRPVTVRGANAYGGVPSTHGTVNPGDTFFSDFAFEYTFTKNWVLAWDAVYTYRGVSTFKGYSGLAENNTLASVGSAASEQFSMVPAIEYNFSASLGMIAGVGFSLYSHNLSDYVSGMLAVNYVGNW